MSGGKHVVESWSHMRLALNPELKKKLEESGVLQRLQTLKGMKKQPAPVKPAGEHKAAEWRKSAQSALDSLKFDPQAMMVDAKDRLAEFWARMSPETKRTLLNAAMGAAVGGGVGGAAGGYYAEPGQGLSEAVSKALLGSVLGGATAGLGTAGYQAATAGRSLPGEERHFNPMDRLANTVVGGMVHNPGLTAGAGLGGWSALRGAQNLAEVAEAQRISDQATRGLTAAEHYDRLARNPGLLADMMLRHNTAMRGGVQMLGLPAGIGMGWLIDRYLKGKNE